MNCVDRTGIQASRAAETVGGKSLALNFTFCRIQWARIYTGSAFNAFVLIDFDTINA